MLHPGTNNVQQKDFYTPIVLNYEERDNFITVVPENADLFYMTVDKAIEACKAFNFASKFSAQFDKLLNRLAEWLNENKYYYKDAFLTVRDAGLLFLIVLKSKKYDDMFEDILTDLDIEIARDKRFDTIKLSVLAVPDMDIHQVASFMEPETSFKIQPYHA
jgi:hypothetical protein